MMDETALRHTRAIRFVVVAAALLVAAACGPAPSPSGTTPGGTTPPSAAASPAGSGVAPTTEPSPVGATVRAYLILGFGRQTGLVPVLRSVEPGLRPADVALRALLAGPNEVERAAERALYTTIPPETGLLGLAIENGVATVDLSGAFEAETEDGLSAAFRVAQVVWTVTQFQEVESVRISIDGAVVTTVGPDGFPVDGPVDRLDFTDQLPPLFVDEPAWGGTLASPVRVAGLANAFEATFQVRIADDEGRGLAAGTITATCGTGCWGTFDELIPFAVSAPGPGILQVYELSPRDGTPDNVREYPVVLMP